MPATDTWKIYLDTGDMAGTVHHAEGQGAQIRVPAMPVADLGIQTVMTDPTGADLGVWQAGTFPGFTVLEEHGAPSWFELCTREYPDAVAFYSSVFPLEAAVIADSPEFRYTTLKAADGSEAAGIMDGAGFLPDGVPSHWTTYWEVDDVDASASLVVSLGGSVPAEPADSPYGRMATVTDPAGARFRLRTGPT
jgi:predicted enzyme related to lactoylglutathione lyase